MGLLELWKPKGPMDNYKVQLWKVGVGGSHGLPPPTWLHGDPFIRGWSSFCTISPEAAWVREIKCRFEVSKLFNLVILVPNGMLKQINGKIHVKVECN